jgi:hypothetical protein
MAALISAACHGGIVRADGREIDVVTGDLKEQVAILLRLASRLP